MSQYIAIICDLIHSRTIPDRRNEQEQIIKVLEDFNELYQEILVSNMTLTLGDEFQMLLKADKKVIEMLDNLERCLKLPFRCGIGFGQISTEINPEISIGADGEAYWKAREALNYVHNKDWGGIAHICFRGLREEQEAAINALFLTTDAIKSNWTDLQRETFYEMLRCGIYQPQFEQNAFAKELKISPSSLSKRLSSGDIKIYLEGRNNIACLLEVWCAEHIED